MKKEILLGISLKKHRSNLLNNHPVACEGYERKDVHCRSAYLECIEWCFDFPLHLSSFPADESLLLAGQWSDLDWSLTHLLNALPHLD